MSTLDYSNVWDRLTSQLQEKYPQTEQEARQMAKDILVKRGHLDEEGKLTEEGEARSLLGAEGRAIDRAIKKNPSNRYIYDEESNQARVVKPNVNYTQ